MNDNGWIKLYRELIDKPIWINSTLEQRVILITLLCMANHKPKKWEFKGSPYEVQAGQFITSVKSIASKCSNKDITTQKVRTALKRFKNLGFLTIETTSKDSLITIVNWELYQNYTEQDNKQNNNQLTNGQQSTNNQVTTNKNVKNDKNEKNILTISKDIVCHSDVQQVIEKWNELESFGIIAVKKISSGSKRYNSVIARIKQYGLQDVLQAIGSIKQSPFLQGENAKDWAITFDWFVKPSNFVKVLEGNYLNRDLQKNNSEKISDDRFRYTEA
ncbi:MAG: hypothetical protein Q4D26_12175 [Clostridia bacterium]|nr:hypothetical protein [Clostridia bacterium]